MINKHKLTMALLGALLAGIALFIYLAIYNRQNISDNINQILNEPNPTGENTNLNLESQPDYKIQAVLVNNVYDTSLIDAANGNTIVVASTAKLCGKPLDEYVFLNGSTVLYLTPYNPGADIPLTELYSLNVKTQTCQIMKISQKLQDFGQKILSPDRTKIAVVLEKSPRQLLLLDLITDTSKILITLPVGQTFNGGSGGLSNFFAIRWSDNFTISYTVFTETDPGADQRKPVIGERVIKVQ